MGGGGGAFDRRDADVARRVREEGAELAAHSGGGFTPCVPVRVGLRGLGVDVGDELLLAGDAPLHRPRDGDAADRAERGKREHTSKRMGGGHGRR